MMRVYIPATAADVHELSDWSRLPGPRDAYALTGGVRRGLADLDDEEAEWALTAAAAEASVQLLHDQGIPRGRRVVVVAHVDDQAIDQDEGVPGLVRLTDGLALAQVACLLADAAEMDTATQPEDDLAWYATQELAQLLA